MKKIAITGPHCCGKSTVIREIKERFKDNKDIRFEFFSGSSSPVDYSSASNLENNHVSEIDITYWMITKMIEREVQIEYVDGEIAILDRCIIDQIVYPSVLLDSKYHKDIFDFLKLWLKIHPYNKVFYIPKNYELLSKYGTKDKSTEYLDLIEGKYLETLKDLDIDYTILSKNQEEQIQEIIEFLENSMTIKRRKKYE